MLTTIVNSPNIKGDISSCKTELSILNGSSRSSLFYRNDTGWATNNCTGVTQEFHLWSLTGFSVMILLIISVMIIAVFFKFLDKSYYN